MSSQMIRKFVRIQNIGKFRDCKAVGDVELGEFSLLYAENGRGKTTLCDALRSLGTGDGNLVKGRKTLGPSQPASVEIRLEKSSAIFDGDQWSDTLPELHIFDSRFIHENVYSGEVVEHEQKRNLLRIIVGERGVSLARHVDSLDNDIREAANVIKSAKLAVAELAPSKMSPDIYVSLESDPGIDAKIKAKDGELVALRRSEEIEAKALLARVDIPTLPSALPTVLAKELDNVSASTEQLVHELSDVSAFGIN